MKTRAMSCRTGRRRNARYVARKRRHYRHHWWPVHRGQTRTFSHYQPVSIYLLTLYTLRRHYRHRWWPVHRGLTRTFSHYQLVSVYLLVLTLSPRMLNYIRIAVLQAANTNSGQFNARFVLVVASKLLIYCGDKLCLFCSSD